MSTLKDSRPVMAEALVRHVLGDTTNFERVCTQRGVSLTDAIAWALQAWMAGDASLPPDSTNNSGLPLMLPDPTDCPQGQETAWLEICEHDLGLLRAEHNRCLSTGDLPGINRTARSIDAYLQAMSELQERVA